MDLDRKLQTKVTELSNKLKKLAIYEDIAKIKEEAVLKEYLPLVLRDVLLYFTGEAIATSADSRR